MDQNIRSRYITSVQMNVYLFNSLRSVRPNAGQYNQSDVHEMRSGNSHVPSKCM